MEWGNNSKPTNQTWLCGVYTWKTSGGLPKPNQFKKYINCLINCCLHPVSFMNLFSAHPSLLFSLPSVQDHGPLKVLLFLQNKLM